MISDLETGGLFDTVPGEGVLVDVYALDEANPQVRDDFLTLLSALEAGEADVAAAISKDLAATLEADTEGER